MNSKNVLHCFKSAHFQIGTMCSGETSRLCPSILKHQHTQGGAENADRRSLDEVAVKWM